MSKVQSLVQNNSLTCTADNGTFFDSFLNHRKTLVVYQYGTDSPVMQYVEEGDS